MVSIPVGDIPENAKKYIVARVHNGWLWYVDSFDEEKAALGYADRNGYLVALNNPDSTEVSTVKSEEITEEIADALVSRRIKAGDILVDENKNADVKLFEIFNLYKEDLRKFPQFFYAMLNWKDSHHTELRKSGCISFVPGYMRKNFYNFESNISLEEKIGVIDYDSN